MNNNERNIFIEGFVKGFMECNLERFGKRAGKQMLNRVRGIDYSNIEKLSELKAIHALLYNNVYHGTNFTLGEVLEALDKTPQQAKEIKEGLSKVSTWKIN